MKGSSMFVPGLCAGALLTVFMLAFVTGAATSERPRTAESQTFSIVYYPTVTSERPSRAGAAPDRNAEQPAISAPAAGQAAKLAPSMQISWEDGCNQVEFIEAIPAGESAALSGSCVLSSSIRTVFAAPEICQIQRDTCAYGHLVGNLDPGILFTWASNDKEDSSRLMHPALLRPLASLRDIVLKRWQGKYSLTVLGAYDETGGAGINDDFERALRTQGQLVILALSPALKATNVDGEPNPLAMLCGMAFRAGFDWVKNDGDTCHAAMKAPPLCAACLGAAPTPKPTVWLIPLTTPVAVTPTPSLTPAPTDSPPQPPSSSPRDGQPPPVWNPEPIP